MRRTLAWVFTPPRSMCVPSSALLLVGCFLRASLVWSLDWWLQLVRCSLEDDRVFCSSTSGALLGLISSGCWGLGLQCRVQPSTVCFFYYFFLIWAQKYTFGVHFWLCAYLVFRPFFLVNIFRPLYIIMFYVCW